MMNWLRKSLAPETNERDRFAWLGNVVARLPKGSRVLDAGAGELRNKVLCNGLEYVAQDFCQYEGIGDGKGLQTGAWNTRRIDLVSDITCIPDRDQSYDAILCTEVLEHVPDPLMALDEFSRLLKPGGKLILTAPFSSLVHFAPFHFCSGFSRYWYEHHLPLRDFEIVELTPNGDWFSMLRQELARLPGAAKQYGDRAWPLAYVTASIGLLYFLLRGKSRSADDLAAFGWLCVAVKK